MREYLKARWEDFKAWRRGERRREGVPRNALRGRVYERKDVESPAGYRPRGTARIKNLKMTVHRAKTGTTEVYEATDTN